MKPHSMSVKEWLIKKLAIRIMISEKVINTVITNQFDQANDALNTNDQVEISGFGKYIFNKKKAKKRLADNLIMKEDIEKRLALDSLKESTRKTLENRLDILNQSIKSLKPRLDETK